MGPHRFLDIFNDHQIAIQFGDVAEERPHLAVKAARIISIASEIDTQLGDTLVAMLGAEAKPAIAIFSILKGAHLQANAMIAAGKEVLDDRTLSMLEAVLNFTDDIKKHRNNLAHWHWGISHRHPDFLLLLRPEDKRAQDRWTERLLKLGSGPLSEVDELEWENQPGAIMAYRENDLDHIIEEMYRVKRAVAHFQKLVSPNETSLKEELWSKLLEQCDLNVSFHKKLARRKLRSAG